ncbi:hypothetical protein ACHAXH_002339 [Discostella pseudostelligera]|jgi:hypothetical protein
MTSQAPTYVLPFNQGAADDYNDRGAGDDPRHSKFAAVVGRGDGNSAGFLCRSEYHFQEMNQSLPILVAMCRGLTNEEGAPLIDIEVEPWCSIRPLLSVRPKAKDYVREIERRWCTFVGTHQNYKGGPRPKKWTLEQLTDWLDNNPIVDDIDVAFLTSKVQEAKADVIDGTAQLDDTKVSSSGDGSSAAIDVDANNSNTKDSRNRLTENASFVRLNESIKWLGTSVLASARLYAAQKEQDREMAIEENEKDRDMKIAENEKDRNVQLELAKLEAEKREKEIAAARARERISILHAQIDSLRKDKRQLTIEALSDNKRSKTVEDFLTVELRQITKDIEQKEVELNKFLLN